MAEGELIGGIFIAGGHPNTPGMKYPALLFQRPNPVSFFFDQSPSSSSQPLLSDSPLIVAPGPPHLLS